MSYAETVRKVEDDGLSVREPERVPVISRPVQSDPNSLCVSNVGFLAFINKVINCTAQMERKSQGIEWVAAAAKFLDELQGGLEEWFQTPRPMTWFRIS